MSDPINVFVYGTLLFPEITQRLRIVSRGETTVRRNLAVLRGYHRLTVEARGEADPPAIFESDAETFVEGNVLLDITEDSLQRLDWFESIADGLYTRETVTAEITPQFDKETTTTGDLPQSMEVFTYVCGERIRSLLRGDWDPASFRANYLEWYLANVLPEEGLP